ncbi:hypothetical protein ACHAWF_012994 [Thalassiosira exigua]
MKKDDGERLPLIGDPDDPPSEPYGTLGGIVAGSHNLTIGRATGVAADVSSPRGGGGGDGGRRTPRPGDGAAAAPASKSEHESFLQTYTPGEDPARLAAAAREMGLERRRTARPPLRSFDYEGRAKAFFRQTFSRIVFVESAAEESHDFWETVAGVAGNVLEWYDFAVFGYFGDIIGRVFFPPNQSSNVTTMESFMVFGGAFLMRPVGGLLLGYLGDVYGRRRALYVSIFLMAWPTFLMGCLPSFERVGYLAPIMLIIIRALQGMSVGGQLMSSLVFTLENVPRESWGLYGSFVWATGNFGVLLGGLVGYAIREGLDENQLIAFGWRIPFLSGVVVSFAGFYLRKNDKDEATAESRSADHAKPRKEKTNPFATMFEPGNVRPLLAASMVPMIWSAGFYLSFVW